MATRPIDDNRAGFRITGRKVFFGLVAFFGVITIANIFLIWLAIGSFPGVVTSSAYEAGREYPQVLEAAKAQRALGWQVEEHILAGGPTDPITIRIDANDGSGAPLSGLAIVARLESPTHEGLDRTAHLAEGEIGLYRGIVEGLPAGQYDLALDATAGDGTQFRSVNRIVITESGQAR